MFRESSAGWPPRWAPLTRVAEHYLDPYGEANLWAPTKRKRIYPMRFPAQGHGVYTPDTPCTGLWSLYSRYSLYGSWSLLPIFSVWVMEFILPIFPVRGHGICPLFWDFIGAQEWINAQPVDFSGIWTLDLDLGPWLTARESCILTTKPWLLPYILPSITRSKDLLIATKSCLLKKNSLPQGCSVFGDFKSSGNLFES